MTFPDDDGEDPVVEQPRSNAGNISTIDAVISARLGEVYPMQRVLDHVANEVAGYRPLERRCRNGHYHARCDEAEGCVLDDSAERRFGRPGLLQRVHEPSAWTDTPVGWDLGGALLVQEAERLWRGMGRAESEIGSRFGASRGEPATVDRHERLRLAADLLSIASYAFRSQQRVRVDDVPVPLPSDDDETTDDQPDDDGRLIRDRAERRRTETSSVDYRGALTEYIASGPTADNLRTFRAALESQERDYLASLDGQTDLRWTPDGRVPHAAIRVAWLQVAIKALELLVAMPGGGGVPAIPGVSPFLILDLTNDEQRAISCAVDERGNRILPDEFRAGADADGAVFAVARMLNQCRKIVAVCEAEAAGTEVEVASRTCPKCLQPVVGSNVKTVTRGAKTYNQCRACVNAEKRRSRARSKGAGENVSA